MYPPGPEADLPPAASYDESLQTKITSHLEGVVPIVLIIIIGLFIAINFDVINRNTPILGALADIADFKGGKTKMLLLGSSSQQVIDILNDNRDIIDMDQRTLDSIERNPSEILADYKIVMLDQSEESNKEVTKKVGEAVQRYVKNGGRLILVMDSGIRRPGTFDVIGWRNTFGDVVPVECDRIINNQPSCVNRQFVTGKLLREDEDNRIMQGIDVYPAEPYRNAVFTTFDVTPTGKEIAYIKSENNGKSYPAIVEKRLVIGKSIYFNYNPGTTRGIFESTLYYLR